MLRNVSNEEVSALVGAGAAVVAGGAYNAWLSSALPEVDMIISPVNDGSALYVEAQTQMWDRRSVESASWTVTAPDGQTMNATGQRATLQMSISAGEYVVEATVELSDGESETIEQTLSVPAGIYDGSGGF